MTGYGYGGPPSPVKPIFLPTVESCWDFGISRNAPLLPFLGSTLPYSFLRGVQYDTKVFKLSELLESNKSLLTSAFTNAKARNEVIFHIVDEERYQQAIEDNTSQTIVPKTTVNGQATTRSVESKSSANINEESFLKQELHLAVENDSDLTSSITNKWSGGDDILTQAIQGIAEISKNIMEIGRGIGYTFGPKEMIENLGVPFNQVRYKGTDFGTITLNFNLFTRNNYIRDIFLPLNYLKSLCLPTKTNAAKNINDAILGYANDYFKSQGLSYANVLAAKTRTADQNAIITSVEFAQSAIRKMGERFKIIKSPPRFKVTHSAKLFFLKKAVVTNFTYKPAGPWVRVEYDGLFSKIFGSLGNSSSVGTALDRLLRDEYIKFAHYPDCYPTRIACSMTLQETEFITLEDYNNELSENTDIVNTEIINQGNLTSSLLAGGIAQNLDVLTPDIKGSGDLLSGGRWVPPGETMSGIPGFL